MIGDARSNFLTKACREYVDLVTLRTISDVMTLTDENRLIAAYGLSLIENSPRLGLLALMDYADGLKNRKYQRKRRVTASYIGFSVAPRINAAGRIADASLGVELFATDSRAEADRIAAELCELNIKRQAEENRIAETAMELAEKTHDFKNDPVLVLASESWHHGIIGIVSSRLTEKYNMPSILISVEDGVGKGSGRSVKGLNISDALTECSDILIRYGGHELAAGLTVSCENIDELRRRINDYARKAMSGDGSEISLDIDTEISSDEINLKLCEEAIGFEPCGVGNPQPIFLSRGMRVCSVDAIGEGGKHTKLSLDGATALFFGASPEEADVAVGDTVDAVFRLDVNEFRGSRTAQMMLSDIRPSDFDGTELDDYVYLEGIENGNTFSDSDLLPDRDDFANVFKEVRGYGEQGRQISLRRLSKILLSKGYECRPAKLKLALSVLADVGIIFLEKQGVMSLSGSELYRMGCQKTTDKVNLFGTPRYKAVKSRFVRG
jgi:single-stranded-DNA-specific exonuclease